MRSKEIKLYILKHRAFKILILLVKSLFSFFKLIVLRVKVFANGQSHIKDFKNGTWCLLA